MMTITLTLTDNDDDTVDVIVNPPIPEPVAGGELELSQWLVVWMLYSLRLLKRDPLKQCRVTTSGRNERVTKPAREFR